jgi:hypothetical protein
MRRVNLMFALAIAATLPTASSRDTYAENISTLITGKSLGGVTIGMTAHDVVRMFGRHRVVEVDLQLEALPTPALNVLGPAGEELATAELNRAGYVYRISTHDPRFRTREGIRVGSSMRQVVSRYGRPEVLVGEGAVFAVYRWKSGDVSMQTDVQASSTLTKLPPDAKIISILVLGPYPYLLFDGE